VEVGKNALYVLCVNIEKALSYTGGNAGELFQILLA
jgi:hypothetical protein